MARGRASGRRPDYQWLEMSENVQGVDLAEGTTSEGNAFIAFGSTATIMRCRGLIGATLDPTAQDETVLVVFGLALASSAAVTAATASLPSPVAEPSYPWIWQGQLYLSSGAEAGVVAASQLVDRVVIDSKAMRRVKGDETLFLMAEVATSRDQGGTFDFGYYSRVLIAS